MKYKTLPRLEYCLCRGDYVKCLKCANQVGEVVDVLDNNFYNIRWCNDQLFTYKVHRTNLSSIEDKLVYSNTCIKN